MRREKNQPNPLPQQGEGIGGALMTEGSIALIVLAGVILYINTLHVPWYLDDRQAIVQNMLLRDLGATLTHVFSPRGVANLGFALNFRFGGATPYGFHLVNIAIHLGASIIAFLLLRRIFVHKPLLALAGALLFLAHPLQTQAVTYVVQRMTSLCGFFFLLALYAYGRAREKEIAATGIRSTDKYWYSASLVAGTLAVFTKENAVVLPLALLLFDRCFLPVAGEGSRRRLLLVFPFFLPPFWILVQKLVVPLWAGQSLGMVVYGGEPGADALSPLTYFVTEWGVIWTYLSLLFFPVGQALDYHVPLASLWNLKPLLAGSGLAALLGVAWAVRRRRPRIAFAIAWFFLTLAVESSIIPLDPLFEHRLYLPMFGFVVAVVDLCSGIPRTAFRYAVLGGLLLVLSVLTWRRNALWNEPIAFYEANRRLMPGSVRVWLNLADAYDNAGRIGESIDTLREAIRSHPTQAQLYKNLYDIYLGLGEEAKALAALDDGLQANPEAAELYDRKAMFLFRQGKQDEARQLLNQALASAPHFPPAYNSLGIISESQGRLREAEDFYRQSLQAQGGSPSAVTLKNLAGVLYKQKRLKEALAEYTRALEIDPRNPETLYLVGMLGIEMGDMRSAFDQLNKLRRIDASRAARLAENLRVITSGH